MSVAYQIVDRNEIHSFLCRCMEIVGTDKNHAKILADALVLADYRGHYSHGLNRIRHYINDIKSGQCNKEGAPSLVKESVSTALVDGNNLLGPVVGTFCMELAIKKAKETGIGWVSARGSNHFGIAGFYSLMAVEQKLIGMSFTNASPFTAVTGGKKPFFGTNPVSIAAPSKEGNDFVLDMATSVVAYGKVEIRERKGESIPENWAIDDTGKTTSDPKKFCALMPLGGGVETSGYKGYGLAMAIEIFCALLSGSNRAPNIRQWTDHSNIAGLGQCFVALDPEFFEPSFAERMSEFISDVKNQEPAEGFKEVLIAGEPERQHMKLCDKHNGIPYHPNQIKFANEVAESLGIQPPQIIGTTTDISC